MCLDRFGLSSLNAWIREGWRNSPNSGQAVAILKTSTRGEGERTKPVATACPERGKGKVSDKIKKRKSAQHFDAPDRTQSYVPADLRLAGCEGKLERMPGGAEIVRLRQVFNASPRKLETFIITLPATFSP